MAGHKLTARQVETNEELTSRCGVKLHCYYWDPPSRPKALVILSHGYSEHLGLYQELASLLAAEGFLAFGHDHVGHGKSSGERVQMDSIHQLVDHVLHHIRLQKERHDLPVFAVGHSMGGMIALAAAIRDAELLNGVVLAGPSIHLDPALATPFRMWLARTVSWIAPHLPVARLDHKSETRDAQVLERRKEDALIHRGGVKARTAVAILDMLIEINQMLFEMSVPFLVLHGADDRICHPGGSQHLYDNAVSMDKEIKMFPGAFHNLYQEVAEVRLQAVDDTIRWIRQRVPH